MEKVKQYQGIAVILALVAFAYGAVSYVSTYSKTIEPGTYRSFSVSGEGKMVAVPDVAMFTFQIITEGGKDLAVLQKTNTEKANQALVFVKSKGVDAKDIRTEGYAVNPRYQNYACRVGVCPPAEIVGYTVSQTVSVKIRDFAKIGDVLAGVVQNGANSVSQLDFTIDDRTMVENEAREEAIAKAKAKAEAIARAGGFRLGRLLSIGEGGYPGPIYQKYGRGGDAVAGIAYTESMAPLIEPGSQDVYVNVSLTYEIE